jgi:hypothetical protein
MRQFDLHPVNSIIFNSQIIVVLLSINFIDRTINVV